MSRPPLEDLSKTTEAGASGKSTASQLLLTMYQGLPAHDQAAVELLALDASQIALAALFELLRVTLPDFSWDASNAVETARRLQALDPFVAIDPHNRRISARGGILLRQAVWHGLIDSGRAARIGKALPGIQRHGLERIAAGDQNPFRQRLRSAAALGGAAPGNLTMLPSPYQEFDPVGQALKPLTELRCDWKVLDALHPHLRAQLIAHELWAQTVEPDSQQSRLVASAADLMGHGDERVDQVLAYPFTELVLLLGDWKLIERLPLECSFLRAVAKTCRHVSEGLAADAALIEFEAALKLRRRVLSNKSTALGMPLKLHLACLAQTRDARFNKRIEQWMKQRDMPSSTSGGQAFYWWQAFMNVKRRGETFVEPMLPASARADDWWWLALLLHWAGTKGSPALRTRLREAREVAERANWNWLGQQLDALLETERAFSVAPTLRDWLAPQPIWRTALDALTQVLRGPEAVLESRDAAQSRLLVRVGAEEGLHAAVRLSVVEQRLKGNGWTAGRLLSGAGMARTALERLAPGDSSDRRLLLALLCDSDSFRYYGAYADSRAMSALIGHPNTVADRDGTALRVVAGEITLRSQRRSEGALALRLDPPEVRRSDLLIRRCGDTLVVYCVDAGTRRIAQIVRDELLMPVEAFASFIDLLPDLARRIKVEVDADTLGLVTVIADRRLYARLEPLRAGYSVRVVVRPLGNDGAVYAPGQGPAEVIGGRDGLPARCTRDLAAERSAWQQLQALTPQLESIDPGASVEIDEAEAALGLLEALHDQSPNVVLEWRAGKPLKLARASAQGALQLRIHSQRDWFAAEGGLALDNGQVVALSEVLRALPSAQGRYLRLDDDRILALSGELRQRLQLLRGFADDHGQVQVPKTAAFALDAALEESAERDLAFRRQIQLMKAAQSLQPALPVDFQAELRDYQIEGYRFLMRLAAWDAGACLADDMGLGKTVQALAMLAARVDEGPGLVVAPTSVIRNWRSEALRFAPNLSLRLYGEGDREEALASLANGDVMLVSYGLLAADVDAFAAREFATLVLDEAQAIKNAATRRAQSVRKLHARFRVATTGTPLENHLGELWSLFRVLNPGLLGSLEQFRRRFLTPLERDPRGPQRDILKRLLAPFLLRRTKTEVLAELPPRTEIVVTVEPSIAEAQLLAAMRKQALERLAAGEMPSEQRRVHVLAELTRLRRAACHPHLVAPELKLGSAKVEQLIDLVRELTDNQHRALVFSQFVDYLTLVRARLDTEGIGYQYLDGSTSPVGREAAVAAFQRGEGEVFLLSLKAGGVGLNLTAADYVIHLDPWWNPAVELQASDRAHRIGQTRPVTVYKLVLAGSIEEQILKLHGSKRELIDQVIGEHASVTALGVDELLDLLGSIDA